MPCCRRCGPETVAAPTCWSCSSSLCMYGSSTNWRSTGGSSDSRPELCGRRGAEAAEGAAAATAGSSVSICDEGRKPALMNCRQQIHQGCGCSWVAISDALRARTNAIDRCFLRASSKDILTDIHVKVVRLTVSCPAQLSAFGSRAKAAAVPRKMFLQAGWRTQGLAH
jgi:hypothetical protein